MIRLNSRQVQLTINPSAVTGSATLFFIQHDRARQRTISDAVDYNFPTAPSASPAPVAYLNDKAVAVSGSALDAASGLRMDGLAGTYFRDASSNANNACFTGAQIRGFSQGHVLQGSFIGGLVPFNVTIANARPVITAVSADVTRQIILQDVPREATLSTDFVTLTVAGNVPSSGMLPAHSVIALRAKPVRPSSPCDAIATAANLTGPQLLADSSTSGSVQFRPADVHVSGSLQVQLIDSDARIGSDWIDIPGLKITPAPDIESITCKTSTSDCVMTGTGFETIQRIVDEHGDSALFGQQPCGIPNKECWRLNLTKALKIKIRGLDGWLPINLKHIVTTT